jgi:heptosyltransferase I
VNILFVKLGSIGDVVHTLPALAAVREALPRARISWAVDRRSAEIIRENPLIDRLIEVDTRALRKGRVVSEILPRVREQFRLLRRERFDVAMDLQGLIKSAAIAKLSGAKKRCGFSLSGLREPAARIFMNCSVEIPEQVHVIRKNLLLASGALGLALDAGEPRFPIFTDESHVREAEAISGGVGGEFALLNPGGGWVTKLWPAENFGRLADALWERFGLRSIVTAGPGEEHLGARAISASRSGAAIAAQPSLKGFYELARRASVYVGGDTGPTHIAVAAATPVVGLFGPTEWWRNGSPRADDICVERFDIHCRTACHRRTCSAWICLDIGVEAVVAAVKKRMGGANRGPEHNSAGKALMKNDLYF